MSTVVAIGDEHEIAMFALAGVRCIGARDDHDVIAAWRALDDDVGLAILTPAADRALAGELDVRHDVLTAVTPS